MPTAMSPTLESIATELARQSCDPPGGDARIAIFAAATKELWETELFHPVRLVLQQRSIHGSHAVNLLLRALQRQLMADAAYPQSFVDVGTWTEAWQATLGQADRAIRLLQDLSLRQPQSNLSERYKSVKLIAHLMREQLGSNPRILDLGCSQNHGLKHLALNHPFTPVAGPFEFVGTLNRLLETPLHIGSSTGADTIEPDADSAAWAKACSFYPSELLDQAAHHRYEEIDGSSPAQVDFVRLDAARVVAQDIPGAGDYDMVFASTFLYQLPARQVEQIRRLARSVLKSTGVIVYQDFLELDRNQRLVFPSHWFGGSYPYRTVVETFEKRQSYEVFAWSNGRCRELVPGRDYGRLIG